MKMVGLFSGGKDSTFAVWKAIQKGNVIASLLSFESENPDSYMFHHPNISLTRLQAKAMGIPITIKKTKGEKEKELDDIESALGEWKGKIEGVTAGALASNYQKSRVEAICKRLGFIVFSPAWHRDVVDYWNELLDSGFKVIITKVACEGLGKEWLGKEIDRKRFLELKKLSEKYRFHLGFEGGEAESFVIDCPLFSKKIHIQEAEVIWEGDVGVYNIQKAVLQKNTSIMKVPQPKVYKPKGF